MFAHSELRDRVLVVVLAGGEGSRLMPLTSTRTKPAVPIGSRYRLIDIPLSNAANSGLHKILVLTQGMDKSLNRHLKNVWHSERHFGAFIEVISPQGIGKAYKGDADAVRQIYDDIKALKPDIVLVLPGDHLLKMDLYKFVKFVEDKKADAAISIIKKPVHLASQLGSLMVDENDEITDFREKDPTTPFTFKEDDQEDFFFASMGIYAFRTRVLFKALKQEGNLFGKHIIPNMLSDNMIVGYNYNHQNVIMDRKRIHVNDIIIDEIERSTDSDYWRDVGTIGEYFNANMDLAGITPAFNLYGEKWPFFTESKDLGPAKIIRSEPGGIIESSVLGQGSVLSNVKGRSIVISPQVYVDKSDFENVIVFEGSNIQKCRIRNTIIDKWVHMMNMVVGFDEEEDRRRGIYIDPRTGIRVIPKNYDFTHQFFSHKMPTRSEDEF